MKDNKIIIKDESKMSKAESLAYQRKLPEFVPTRQDEKRMRKKIEESNKMHKEMNLPVDSVDQKFKEHVDHINQLIRAFNQGRPMARGLITQFEIWGITQYESWHADMLRADADNGDELACVDYAEIAESEDGKEFYLSKAAEAGNWRAIKRLVEGGYESGKRYIGIYINQKQSETSRIVATDEEFKATLKTYLELLESDPDNQDKYFAIILSLVGHSQDGDKSLGRPFNFDMYLLEARKGSGVGLGEIDWAADYAQRVLKEAVKIVEDRGVLLKDTFIKRDQFSELAKIAECGRFDQFLMWAFRVSCGKLDGDRIPTAYELMKMMTPQLAGNMATGILGDGIRENE